MADNFDYWYNGYFLRNVPVIEKLVVQGAVMLLC